MDTRLALRTTDPRAVNKALWLSSAGLEATYIYAWGAFALTLMSGQRYSAVLAVSTFAAASLAAIPFKRLRLLELAVLHVAAVALVSLLGIRSLLPIDLGRPSAKAWGTAALVVFFSWSLWRAGFRHGREAISYERVCARFDRGIWWLGALFALKLLWREQRDANLDDGITGSLIAPYFLFAVVAIAGARNRGMGTKSLIGGYGGLGRLANVSVGGLLVTLACGLLFLPELHTAARVSYSALREIGGPIADAFAFLLYVIAALWMLLRGTQQASPVLKEQIVFAKPKAEYRDHAILPAHDMPPWLLAALLGSMLVAVLYILWCARRVAADGGSPFLAALWRRAQNMWRALLERLARMLTPVPDQPEPIRIYSALLQWGRYSGSPHRASETPLEYACRLQRRMPALSAEITLIASTYSAYAYGRRATLECSHEKAALRRLRSLKLWPQRFKLWLTGDGDRNSLQDQTVSEAVS